MLPTVFIDGVPADQIGAVEELSFSRTFAGGQGGGLRDLKITLDLDGYDHHPSLRLHAPVDLRHGAESLGEGRIVSIDRDTWEIVVDGIVRLGEDYECRGADSEPASLAVGLPLAIGRGLPWVIPDGLALPTDVPESMQTITEALNAWVALTDRAWLLDGRTLTVVAEPTAPTLILTATDNPNSSTDGLVTSVTAKYAGAVDEQGRPALISYVTVAADNVPKHVERTIDLTGEGALTESDAADRARSQLVAGTTATLTESVAVAEGALTMHDGKDLSEVLCTIREGQMVRQLDWINPDGSPGLYRDWIIGGVDWSLDDGLVLTPLGAEASTLAGAIIDIRRGIAVAQETADDAQGQLESIPGDIQDAYDAADAAAEAAQEAAESATVALAAANGKNAIWYSTSGPGATPNKAGDTWRQKDAITQTIIAEWEGLGGTSWSPKTLRNEMIANLDAGKLTAGSAFINGLWVKTNFTLGDASTNGVIQSYNFADSSEGVYIDKYGITAKGGTLTGATLQGTTVNGGTLRGGTVETSGTGVRAVMETISSRGMFSIYNGSTFLGGVEVVNAFGAVALINNRSTFTPNVHLLGTDVQLVPGTGGVVRLFGTLEANGNNISGTNRLVGSELTLSDAGSGNGFGRFVFNIFGGTNFSNRISSRGAGGDRGALEFWGSDILFNTAGKAMQIRTSIASGSDMPLIGRADQFPSLGFGSDRLRVCTYDHTVAQPIWASSFDVASDARAKFNEEPVAGALDTLRGWTVYDYLTPHGAPASSSELAAMRDPGRAEEWENYRVLKRGLMAQDVRADVEHITYDDDSPGGTGLSIDLYGLLSTTIAALQELADRTLPHQEDAA